MRGEVQRTKEAELTLTSTQENACIGPFYNIFRSGARSCPHCGPHFRSTDRVSQHEQYGMGIEASLIGDTRHWGQLVRVSAKFQALKNTERQGLNGKTAIVVLSKKCGTKPYPNRAFQ